MRPRRAVFRNAEIPGRIAAMQPFLSEGKLPDGTRRWSAFGSACLGYGHLPARYRASVDQAVYVVYSYATPVAWVHEMEDRVRPYWFFVPDVGYSPTTGTHQAACLEAWADGMRSQGQYRHVGARGREVVRVPGNAEIYGQPRRARAGGMDGVRPGENVGRSSTNDYPWDGYEQGRIDPAWTGHRSHP